MFYRPRGRPPKHKRVEEVVKNDPVCMGSNLFVLTFLLSMVTLSLIPLFFTRFISLFITIMCSQASDDDSVSSGGGKRWRSARSDTRTLRTYSRASLAAPEPRAAVREPAPLRDHLATHLTAHLTALQLPHDPTVWSQVNHSHCITGYSARLTYLHEDAHMNILITWKWYLTRKYQYYFMFCIYY